MNATPPAVTPPPARHSAARTGPQAVADSIPGPATIRGLRWLVWKTASLLTRWIYRIRVEGRENLPPAGGALLVSNHLSLADAFIIGAASGRYVRFLMDERTYRERFLGSIARWVGVIPISSEQRPRDLVRSLRTAAEAIRQGDLVCIFAEGQVTRIGQMLPFRRGFEQIMDGLEAPVIPVCLEGLWGSLFSLTQRRFFWKWPRRLPDAVSLSYGRPLPANTTPAEVRQVVQELACDAWQHRKSLLQPLGRAFAKSARRHPFRFAMGDQRTPRLNFLNTLARTVYLANRLRPHWEGQEKVGILLPPSVAPWSTSRRS